VADVFLFSFNFLDLGCNFSYQVRSNKIRRMEVFSCSSVEFQLQIHSNTYTRTHIQIKTYALKGQLFQYLKKKKKTRGKGIDEENVKKSKFVASQLLNEINIK